MFCLLKFSSGAGKSRSPWHPGEPGDCSFLFIPKSASPAQVWVSAFSQRRSPGLRKSWAATVYSPQASTHLSPAFPSPASYQTKLTAAVSERLGVRVPMHASGRGCSTAESNRGKLQTDTQRRILGPALASLLHFAGSVRDCSDFMFPCFQNYPPK